MDTVTRRSGVGLQTWGRFLTSSSGWSGRPSPHRSRPSLFDGTCAFGPRPEELRQTHRQTDMMNPSVPLTAHLTTVFLYLLHRVQLVVSQCESSLSSSSGPDAEPSWTRRGSSRPGPTCGQTGGRRDTGLRDVETEAGLGSSNSDICKG